MSETPCFRVQYIGRSSFWVKLWCFLTLRGFTDKYSTGFVNIDRATGSLRFSKELAEDSPDDNIDYEEIVEKINNCSEYQTSWMGTPDEEKDAEDKDTD